MESLASSSHSSALLRVASDVGTGRAFGILRELHEGGQRPELLASALAARTRTLLMELPRITQSNFPLLASELIRLLLEKNIRQISLVTFGACGALAQSLALHELKSVRTIVFVDASTRAHPSRFKRFVDKVEHALPLGLPLRLEDRGFDVKPFLQRLRCPALVVTSSKATPYERVEAQVLEAGLPTAWQVEVNGQNEDADLAKLVLEFQEVPAKCPQKRT